MDETDIPGEVEYLRGRKRAFGILNLIAMGMVAGLVVLSVYVGYVKLTKGYYEVELERSDGVIPDAGIQSTVAELFPNKIPKDFTWDEGYRLCPYDTAPNHADWVNEVIQAGGQYAESEAANALILHSQKGKNLVLKARRADFDFCDLRSENSRFIDSKDSVSVRHNDWSYAIIDWEK